MLGKYGPSLYIGDVSAGAGAAKKENAPAKPAAASPQPQVYPLDLVALLVWACLILRCVALLYCLVLYCIVLHEPPISVDRRD